jgi:D-galactarolactone cycloisomerase
LWDIKGKALGRPVYQLLGGACRDRIPAYATGFYFKDVHSLRDEASTYLERGFTAMKLKIGNGVEQDEEIVRAVRDTTGGDTTLMVDANGRYSVKSAIKVGRVLERYDVYWFEEPVPSEDIDGYREVRLALDMAIAGGECEYTRYGFRDLISTRAVDIVQPDCTRAGGITECKKIASMASAWNISYAPHVWGSAVGFAAALQLCCNLGNLALFEYDQTPNPLRDELLTEPFQLKNGFIEIPKSPGLGIELNEQLIRRYRTG